MNNKLESHYDLKNKKPTYMEATYPYKAVGEPIDASKLDDSSCIDMKYALYELKCPNCDLSAHVRGSKLKKYYDIFCKVGCPECKLQFNGQAYIFKDGEKEKPLPKNDGKYNGFIVKRVIKVPEDVFKEYAKRMFNKKTEELTLAEGKEIAEEYYKIMGD